VRTSLIITDNDRCCAGRLRENGFSKNEDNRNETENSYGCDYLRFPAEFLGFSSVDISAFGTASNFVARYTLEKIGLTPGKDVALVQVGGVPDRLGALLAGRIEAAVLVPPSMFIAQKKGLNILADVAKLGLPSRVIARHMGKYIAGEPTIIVENMPGAGTRRKKIFLTRNKTQLYK